MKITTDALIVRENNKIGESDRFVTALTRDNGIIRASVRGARNLKNRNSTATQLLCYSRLTLYRGRDKYIVDDAEPLKVFFEIRGRLDKLALAQYFCELATVLAPHEEPAEEALRLLLNALHYLSEETRPLPLVKAVTELRLLCQAGYTPAVASCTGCGVAEGTWFSPLQGVLLCDNCRGSAATIPLSTTVLAAVRHIVYAPFDRCFAFSLPPTEAEALCHMAEHFLLAQLGRGFNTLDFYHSLI